ncbi:hypothetical protein [Limosilactobacillus secaliphilus]|uniref:hypothetical protein n=1 Tax=Limosilactobacillus secaliphilus TaxID=396268 RepID=UPI00070A933A|nr:hypothetical protein [Limosilactobacillus secaliphilus]
MASNSDALYYVLSKIYHHPELVTATVPRDSNTVQITITDNFKISDSDYYFPINRLSVNRLSHDFVAKNGDLLDYFYDMTEEENPGYHEVWMTTSHVKNQSVYLIELSYE